MLVQVLSPGPSVGLSVS